MSTKKAAVAAKGTGRGGTHQAGIVQIDPDNLATVETRQEDDFAVTRGSTWTRQLRTVLALWQACDINDDEYVKIGSFNSQYSATQTASRLRRHAVRLVPEIVDPDGAPTEVEFEWVFKTTRNAHGSELWVAIAAVGP